MSYEVTKQIKGREYRYRVTGSRWEYLGRVDGNQLVAPARTGVRRASRDEIAAVTAKLLDTRDASRVTVGVISQYAGISPGTFYRHFADRDDAMRAALVLLCERCVRMLPSLAPPIRSLEDERERLGRWFDVLRTTVLTGRAFRWFLTLTGHEKIQAGLVDVLETDPRALLADYFRELNRAGLARIDDPIELAHGLMSVNAAVLRDIAVHGEVDGFAASRWADVFPVIEHAVFTRAA